MTSGQAEKILTDAGYTVEANTNEHWTVEHWTVSIGDWFQTELDKKGLFELAESLQGLDKSTGIG